MKNISISEKEFKFLKELQHEMLTQDNAGQASPRFWVVMDYKKVYGISNDYEVDGYVIIDTVNDCIECWDSEGDVDLEDWFKEELERLGVDYEDIGAMDMTDVKEVVATLSDYLNYEIVNYRIEGFIVPDTLFLTNRECKEHIERNYYHYTDKVHSYAMTAWRSPQVSKLYEVLENLKLEEEQ